MTRRQALLLLSVAPAGCVMQTRTPNNLGGDVGLSGGLSGGQVIASSSATFGPPFLMIDFSGPGGIQALKVRGTDGEELTFTPKQIMDALR